MSRTDIPVLIQQALNTYDSGLAALIVATDGSVLHGRETLARGGKHTCVFFPDVDPTAFQQTNANEVLEQARLNYLRQWDLGEQRVK